MMGTKSLPGVGNKRRLTCHSSGMLKTPAAAEGKRSTNSHVPIKANQGRRARK